MPSKTFSKRKRKWQVWRTKVQFQQDPKDSKPRPFLISKVRKGFVIGHEMTSKEWQHDRDPDRFYEVKDKGSAGLTAKHSYIHLKKSAASKLDMQEYQGVLHRKERRLFKKKRKSYEKKYSPKKR